jgi:hypothetical protein
MAPSSWELRLSVGIIGILGRENAWVWMLDVGVGGVSRRAEAPASLTAKAQMCCVAAQTIAPLFHASIHTVESVLGPSGCA